MHLVAVTAVSLPIDTALAPLASLVGSSAYDLRLVLNAGLPAVVLVTEDGVRAAHTVSEIERQGHRAITCSRADVTPSAKMAAVRGIEFGTDSLATAPGRAERLPYSDILCLLRAMHTTSEEQVKQVKERKLQPGMAIATGGLIMSKTTSREVRSSQEQRQQVLYLFRRSGTTPWILRERETNYTGLGSLRAPAALQNFMTTIQQLRSLAPHAVYDETLLNSRSIRGLAGGVDAADVYAHLIAACLCSDGTVS